MESKPDKALFSGIYTLTPTHVGSGEAEGAIDLPIARESITRFPILPGSALKGAARAALKPHVDKEDLIRLFGSELKLPSAEVEDAERRAQSLYAGALIFNEGHLLALPVRSLNRPFLHVTCALVMERLDRELRAVGRTGFVPPELFDEAPEAGHAVAAEATFNGRALVLEDIVYAGEQVSATSWAETLAKNLAGLLPSVEKAARARLRKGLIIIPDTDFQDLAARTPPVQARVKLTRGKTTSRFEDDDSGNLWYEETLPAECLFACLICARPGSMADPRPLPILNTYWQHLEWIQIGGNETVGNGLCQWSQAEALS